LRQSVIEQFKRSRALNVQWDNRARKNDETAHWQNRQLFRNLRRAAFVHAERDRTMPRWFGIHTCLQRVQLFCAHDSFLTGSEIHSNPLRCSACASLISTSTGKVISRSKGP